MLPFIEIAGKQIPMYWLMGLIGVILCSIFVFVRNRRFGVHNDDVLHIILFTCVGGVVGSKILALLTVLPFIIKNWSVIPWSRELVIQLLTEGYVFYGGLLGGVAMAAYYCWRYRIPAGIVMDLAAPAIPLFHMFGRFGCFFAGCCYGVNGAPLQLIEAGINLVIAITLVLLQRYSFSKGRTLYFYFIIYGVCRFILEFFRGDAERGFVGFLSTSQWISIAAITGAAALLIRSYYRGMQGDNSR